VTRLWLDALHALDGRAAGAPVDPSPDRARSMLRRELLRPEYHRDNLLQRILRWLERILDAGFEKASHASALPTAGALLVFLLVLVLLGWLLTRARRSGRPGAARPILTEERLSAARLRERADAALAAGRADEALVEGFRALASRQIERGRLDDLPDATAHEVADSLAATYPLERRRVDDSARLFDLVMYGDRPATREQAAAMLALDDDLAAAP